MLTDFPNSFTDGFSSDCVTNDYYSFYHTLSASLHYRVITSV